MGQVMQKVTGRAAAKKEETDKLNRIIDQCILQLGSDKWGENQVYHEIYAAIDLINKENGGLQIKLPKLEDLQSTFNEQHKSGALTKDEFKRIVESKIVFSSVSMGKGIQDLLLFLFGLPAAGLLAKRIIPGGTAVPDEIFIPAATSGTVFLLAKMKRL